MHRGVNSAAAAPLPSNQEIELKLLVPKGGLDALAAIPVIAQHARNRGIFRRLENAYFDTPDRRLHNGGIALRVRRSGKTFIQTLKRSSEDANPLARHEWETPVTDFVPHLDLLPPEALGVGLDPIDTGSLKRVFVTRVRRRTQLLDFPSACIELAYDEGEIEAETRREPISEIELELKSGDPAALYDLALSLLDFTPLRLGTVTKSQRGYQLAYDLPAQSVRSAKTLVRAEDNVDEIVSKLLGDCQRHLIANQPVVEEGQFPEGVHQMRVALRRMRTAISILQRQLGSPTLSLLAGEAKWLASALGPVRNWDVLDVDTIDGIEAHCDDASAFAALRERIRPRREAGYAVLRELLASPRYSRFVLTLGRVLERRAWRNDVASVSLTILAQPVALFAQIALQRLHRRAVKAGAHFKKLQPEARHELRLLLKKMRYASEFFRNVFGDDQAASRYLRRLSELQEGLGLANDAATTVELLNALTVEDVSEPTGNGALHRGAGLIAGWQARDKLVGDGTLLQAWKRFAHATPFWQE